MINDLLTKGFKVLDGKKYSSQLDVSNIEWEYEGGINNDYHPASDKEFISVVLKTIHTQIELDFIAPHFDSYKLERARIWEGVCLDAQQWHHHFYTHPRLFFLLYWSDTKSAGDGSIWFSDASRTKEYRLWPTPGTLIVANNSNKFLHKVEKTNSKRIIAEFYFDLDLSTYHAKL